MKGLHLNLAVNFALGFKELLSIPLGRRFPKLFGFQDKDVQQLFPFKAKVLYKMWMETGYLHLQATKPDTAGKRLHLFVFPFLPPFPDQLWCFNKSKNVQTCKEMCKGGRMCFWNACESNTATFFEIIVGIWFPSSKTKHFLPLKFGFLSEARYYSMGQICDGPFPLWP